jgi:hypothetical protein
MKTFREKKVWYFFQTKFDNIDKQIIVGYRYCKDPRRTKIYRELLDELNLPGIVSCGYKCY